MRCAIYARVSTKYDSQKTSIDNQIDYFRHYAAKNNWEVTKIYTDVQSVTKRSGSGLKDLIEDAKAGLFDVIVAKELARFARNGRLSYELRDTCILHNIDIVCLDDSIDTTKGDMDKFGLYVWMYETEAANTSRRNKQAKQAKARRGLFVGSTPLYGYYSENGVLKVREDETPNVVRRIFNCYLEGTGMDSIAKSLTAEKVPTPSQIAKKSNASNLWHASTIKNILKNRHYCGDLVQNRTETIAVTTTKRRTLDEDGLIIQQNTHEPIISRDVFQTVQKMLQSRTRTSTAPKKHFFTNMLYCEDCKKGLWYKANQKAYRCGGNLKYGDSYCLNRKVVREKELKNVILSDLQELFQSFPNDSLMENLSSKANRKHKQMQQELINIEHKTKELRKRKLNYVNLYTEQVITKEELIEYKELVDQELKELDINRTQLVQNLTEGQDESYTVDLLKKLKAAFLVKDLAPQTLHSLVKKITCTTEGTIEIHYNFSNDLIEN
ncbi:recombinase family protein [Priestia aryabhattai]|uniref:recombinase family protein n=1 Tax=Priestia aryabhattai TaxID=412384 RepID=UPI002E2353EE|nr:recombinase family protein [Priestia aryabhattai]